MLRERLQPNLREFVTRMGLRWIMSESSKDYRGQTFSPSSWSINLAAWSLSASSSWLASLPSSPTWAGSSLTIRTIVTILFGMTSMSVTLIRAASSRRSSWYQTQIKPARYNHRLLVTGQLCSSMIYLNLTTTWKTCGPESHSYPYASSRRTCGWPTAFKRCALLSQFLTVPLTKCNALAQACNRHLTYCPTLANLKPILKLSSISCSA